MGKDDKNGEFSFAEIHSPTGIAYVFEDANGVWVNTAGANGEDAYLDPTQTKKGSVGAPAYQIAQAYARNIGKKFVDDEMGGVSEVARFRRWPQMLSSAIRYGSTSHLDATKDVSRWTDGQDPAFDAGLLAMHEAVLVEKYIPEIKNFRLSEDMSKIVDANGAEVSQGTLDDLETRARDSGALGIGETTLRRAIVTRSAAAETGGNLWRQVAGRKDGELGVFQRAAQDLVSDLGRSEHGLGREHPLRSIAYAEGRSPGPLVANLPRAVRNSGGGWTLHDRATGREIGRAATTGEAIRLASEHAGLDQKDSASMAFLETMFQGADLSGQLHDTLGLNAGTEADISTALESDAATRASAELKARVEAQERMRGGDGSFARLIFGSSTTEIIGNARRVINRILGGGSILTVFHEEGHSLRKAARAAGILTREDDIRMLRAADRILAGKTERRGGGRLSFLPENFDSLSEAEQDVAIDEGISELLEAEILRTRKGGGTRQLPPGLVSRNLSAFSQLAGDRTAGRYRAFIGAFRQFFGLQMSRAMEIQRALENGTLDRTAYEGYLRKLYDGGGEGIQINAATLSTKSNSGQGDFSPTSQPSTIRPLDTNDKNTLSIPDERLRNPATILESLRQTGTHAISQGDAGGGIRADVKERRKHGRQIASGDRLAIWAKENSRQLDPVSFRDVADLATTAGGEHKVLIDSAAERVTKLTKPGFFGAQGEDAGAYLERWALHNRAFVDNVAFEGMVTLPGEDQARAVISQRFARGRDATTEEQTDFLTERGFHRVADDRWMHPIRGIVVWDTITPGNVIMTADGARAIDLQVALAPAAELAELRKRSGIGRETSFSLGPQASSGADGESAQPEGPDSHSQTNYVGPHGQESLSAGNAPDQPHNQQHDKESRMVSGAGKSQEISGRTEEESRRRIREALARRERGESEEDLGDGAESVVVPIGPDQVLKEIKSGGVVRYDSDGNPHTEHSLEAVQEKAQLIEALGGMPTMTLEVDGKIVLIQDRGTPITETEYLSIELPFGIEPTRRGIYKVEINGNTYLISDLKPENFVKDSQGNIRLIDLITGKIGKAGDIH